MSQVIRNEYFTDYFSVNTELGKIDENTLENLNRLKELLERRAMKMLCREESPLALISGAGIAGLAASFELRRRGFNVVIAEKRGNFSRFNVINLNVEIQAFLKKFNLLEKFEQFVASRIQEHRYVVIEKTKTARRLGVSTVSDLQFDESTSLEPKNSKNLFTQDGIYSVRIRDLQTFLAEHALEAGVRILGNVTPKVLARTSEGGVSEVQITEDQTLQPDLFFIAEGASSTTALQLGFKTTKVTNACSGENWIFGNMTYSGKETFVVSLIDTSEKTLRIANVIFNAKSQVINIAVTSNKGAGVDNIREQLLQTAQQVFDQRAFPLEKRNSTLLNMVDKPVQVVNRTSSTFSMGNVFCIGDAAGSSSPLAGLGGTLGLTLVPSIIRKLLDDYTQRSKDLHKNFKESSEEYTTRWFQKSEGIKVLCLSIFEKEHNAG